MSHKFINTNGDIHCEYCGLIVLSRHIPTMHEAMLENRKKAEKPCPTSKDGGDED